MFSYFRPIYSMFFTFIQLLHSFHGFINAIFKFLLIHVHWKIYVILFNNNVNGRSCLFHFTIGNMIKWAIL